MIQTIFILLIVFQIKHLLADYFLQTRYMLGKFNPGWSFLLPLSSHCAVHALFTLIIAICFGKWMIAVQLAKVDFVIHFVMDRIKAGPKYLGRFKDATKPQFWWCLGFDQMVHHVTHYGIIMTLVAGGVK